MNYSYNYRVQKFPGYVVLKKEGNFWNAKGTFAETIRALTGYKITKYYGVKICGSSNLLLLKQKLDQAKMNYVFIDDNEVCIKKKFVTEDGI